MTADIDEMANLRSQDPAALGSFHDRYFPELYRYARYRVGDPDQAEDLAAETFIRLLEALHSGRGPSTSLRGWLFGTLRHLVDDHHRRGFAHPRSSIDPGAADSSSDVVSQVEARMRAEQVRRALRRLTPDQQHVLALQFGGEHSIDETAFLMDRKPNAVKALQHRALQALRRGLEDAR